MRIRFFALTALGVLTTGWLVNAPRSVDGAPGLRGGLAGAARPATAPATRPAASTGHDHYRGQLEVNRQTLAGAYDRVGKRNAKWDAGVRDLLEAAALHFASGTVDPIYVPPGCPTRAQVIAKAKLLVEAGCDDALVTYIYGALLQDINNAAEATPLLRRALAGLIAQKYPPRRIAAAAGRMQVLSTDPGEVARAASTQQEHAVAMLCGNQTPAERRFNLAAAWTVDLAGAPRARQQALYDALAARADADPYVKDVIGGILNTSLAWDVRGGAFANKVTPAGWEGMHRHMAIARDCLVRAWKLAPALPEAPTAMIAVAMGDGRQLNEDPHDWFERALAAQADHAPAYEAIYGAMLPRWGGTYQAMLELGAQNVVGERYDTVLPWQFIRALERIEYDAPAANWKALRNPPLYDAVKEICDTYAAAEKKAGRPARHDWYKSYRAAFGWRSEQYDDARAALNEVLDGPDPVPFIAVGAPDGAEAIGHVYAMSGAHAARVRAAEATADADPAGALAELKAARKLLVPNDPSAAYFDPRIAALDRIVRYAAGEWVPLMPDARFAGWRKQEGTWEVAPGVVLGSHKVAEGFSALLWMNETFPAASFEVAGRIEFADEGAAAAGVVLHSEKNLKRSYYIFDMTHQGAGLVRIGGGVALQPRPMPVAKVSDFVVRCADGVISAELNGKSTGEPQKLPEFYLTGDLRIGLGGVGGKPTRYSNIQIRKPLAGEKNAPAPAPGPAPAK